MSRTDWTADSLFATLKHVTLGGSICLYTPEICAQLAPLINAINTFKKEKNAIILAHSYVVPEIAQCVADFVGDSYGLSVKAKETQADTIVFAAVKFMAETAKLLNPTKTVLVPSALNGCSLADSITAADVQLLKQRYPNHVFMCYINTTAEVKALCDICVTSSNVYTIAERIEADAIYFLPDRLMAQNLIKELEKRGCTKTVDYWDGRCYVHDEYSPEMIDYIRSKHTDIDILAHPECAPDVVEKTDFTGSTSEMISHVKSSQKSSFFMLTECGLTSRLQTELADKQFVGTCTMCKYMKSNSLKTILNTLENPAPSQVITLDPNTQKDALRCIEAMFKLA